MSELDFAVWLGQSLALDLADTVVVVRPGEEVDLLETEGQLARWLELERERLGDAGPDVVAHLPRFRRLREAVRELAAATVDRRPLPEEAAAVVNRASAAAPRYLRLDRSGLVVATAATDRTDAILGAIAASAVELLGGRDRERVRRCPAPRCGMYFTATRGGQAWCSPQCGNRARVARHYARHARR